jgi:predicted transcriptional regulator
MNQKLNLGLSLAAGVLGGILSHYIAPKSVLAQSPVAPPKEITAQSFVLVNSKGAPFGTFGFEKDGAASIKLFDASGKVLWSEDGKLSMHQLTATN